MISKTNIHTFKKELISLLKDRTVPFVWVNSFEYKTVIKIIKDDFLRESEENTSFWCHSYLEKKLTEYVIKGAEDDKQIEYRHKDGGESLSDCISTWYHNIDRERMSVFVAIVSNSTFKKGSKVSSTIIDFITDVTKKWKNGNSYKGKIVLISNSFQPPIELAHTYEYLEMPLPDENDVISTIRRLQKNKEILLEAGYNTGSDKNWNEICDAVKGMSHQDIEKILKKLNTDKGCIKPMYEGVYLKEIIHKYKEQIVKNSGLLEVVSVKDGYENTVADIGALKEYVSNQKKYLDNKFFLNSNLPKPKGVLLVGAPGCGKSEAIKAIASILRYPLYRLNIGDILGKYVGQSESQFKEALRTADASAPCILCIDEIEKALAGGGDESGNDKVMTHIIGSLLTWMQEHQTLVYIVATANDISKMRPELLRKGRWDEVFYMTYPSEQGIISIFNAKSNEFNIAYVQMGEDILEWKSDAWKSELKQIAHKLKEGLPKISGAEITSIITTAASQSFIINNEQNTSSDLSSTGEQTITLRYSDLIKSVNETLSLTRTDSVIFSKINEFTDDEWAKLKKNELPEDKIVKLFGEGFSCDEIISLSFQFNEQTLYNPNIDKDKLFDILRNKFVKSSFKANYSKEYFERQGFKNASSGKEETFKMAEGAKLHDLLAEKIYSIRDFTGLTTLTLPTIKGDIHLPIGTDVIFWQNDGRVTSYSHLFTYTLLRLSQREELKGYSDKYYKEILIEQEKFCKNSDAVTHECTICKAIVSHCTLEPVFFRTSIDSLKHRPEFQTDLFSDKDVLLVKFELDTTLDDDSLARCGKDYVYAIIKDGRVVCIGEYNDIEMTSHRLLYCSNIYCNGLTISNAVGGACCIWDNTVEGLTFIKSEGGLRNFEFKEFTSRVKLFSDALKNISNPCFISVKSEYTDMEIIDGNGNHTTLFDLIQKI